MQFSHGSHEEAKTGAYGACSQQAQGISTGISYLKEVVESPSPETFQQEATESLSDTTKLD